MIFRPLCIDYRTRAQEVLAIDREAQARRAALSLLPHRVCPPSRHDDGPSSRCDDAGSRPHCDAFEADVPDLSTTALDGSHTVNEGILDNKQRAELKSKQTIQSIFQKLGPAVHPSECALRKISPVTKGPIRNRLLKIGNSKPVLGELVKAHETVMHEKMMAVVSSLESGSWRLTDGMSHDYQHLFDNEYDSRDAEVIHPIFKTCQPRGDLFYQTMTALYSRNGYLCEPFDPATVSNNRATQSTIDTTYPSNSLFLKHEPPDLSKIHRLKSLQASDATSYAQSLLIMFQPELKSLSEKSSSRSLVCSKISQGSDLSGRVGILHSQTKFNIVQTCGSESMTVDYSSRSELVPFTKFFQNDDKDDSSINASEKNQRRYTMDSIGCFIRSDPCIDTIDRMPMLDKATSFTAELSKSMDALCSATSILAKLKLPTRFENGQDLVRDKSRFFMALERPRFKFLDDAMAPLKNSADKCPSSFETCLGLIESLYVATSDRFVPRRISLESNMLPFGESAVDSELAATTSRNENMSRLPNFSSILSFSPDFQEKGRTIQRRHVISSARVGKAHALKNFIGLNLAPCLFLPQIYIRSLSTSSDDTVGKCQSTKDDPIAQVVRLYVPSGSAPLNMEMLDELKSSYPIEHWFSSDESGLHPPSRNDVGTDCMSIRQKEIIRERRVRFCESAQARGREDKLRTLLSTGCSARTNVGGVFSYRGFLTNQLVDPKVYEFRYASMLEVKKSLRLKSDSKSFVGMSQDILVAALLRDNATSKPSKNKRGALLANCLNTKRHNSLALVQENKSERKQLKTVALKIPFFENLAPLANHERDALPENVMEIFGKTLKDERGELLHLVSKAYELEKEERAYLEELAVLNRHTKTTKHDLFEVNLCDIGVGDDGRKHGIVEADGKRKDPPKPIAKEFDEKKTRKRDKRKNETAEERAARKAAKRRKQMRKEHRKRKRKHDTSPDEHRNFHRIEQGGTPQSELNAPSACATLHRNVKMAAISVPLGITPIVHPVKKKDRHESFVDSNQSADTYRATLLDRETIHSVDASQKIKDSTLSCLSKNNSPISVASLKEGRKLLFSVKKSAGDDYRLCAPRETDDIESHKNDWSGEKVLVDNELFCRNVNGQQFDDDSKAPFQEALKVKCPETVIEEKDSAVLHLDQNENNNPHSLNEVCAVSDAITLLSSEHFLENFPETIAELASGRWVKSLTPREILKVNTSENKKISIVDCPLVDCAGVDIELPDGRGVVVHRLSLWLKDNRVIQKGSRAFIKKLVLLAASGRYKCLHVILCVDNEFTSTLSNEVVTLQNALVQQSGCHCDELTFEFVTLRILSASLALLLLSSSTNNTNIADFVSDEDTMERARFLIMLVPSMPVHVALKCLGCFDTPSSREHSGKAFFEIFCLAKTLRRSDFLEKTNTILPDISAQQLWLALNVDISHAH